jgi:CRP-like cAMP-binding protein
MKAWDGLFDGLDPMRVESALPHFRDVEVPAGTVLMEQGDKDATLIYLLHGGVSVRKDGHEIDVSGPGELIGEMALFRPGPRVAEIVTVIETRALVLDELGYDALVKSHNPVAYRLERMALRQLGHRLRRLDNLISERAEGQSNPYKVGSGLFDFIKKMFGGGPEIVSRSVEAVTVLENSSLFKDERYTFVRALADSFHHTVFATGDVLCEQGDPGDAVHVIAAGKADVLVAVAGSRKPLIHPMGTVGPGSAVGMTALIDDRPRMATIVAKEQVDALTLDRQTFQTLVDEDSQIASSLRRAMIRAFAAQVKEAGANLLAVSGAEVPEYVTAGTTMEVYTS